MLNRFSKGADQLDQPFTHNAFRKAEQVYKYFMENYQGLIEFDSIEELAKEINGKMAMIPWDLGQTLVCRWDETQALKKGNVRVEYFNDSDEGEYGFPSSVLHPAC